MYGVCVTYVRRIGPATYVLRFFKCTNKKRSASAYEVYELRVEEYELRMLTYVRHTRDVPSKLATKAYNMHGWFDFNHFSWAGSNQNSLTVIRWSS